MKKISALLAVCVLFLTGCNTMVTDSNSSEQEETVNVYQALPLPDLLLDIPDSYETTSSQYYEEYYISGDASIIVTEDTADAPYSSSYDYAISALVEYRNTTSSLELLDNGVVYAGGIAVQTLEFTYTIGEGEDCITKTCMVGYLTNTNTMYIITCKSDVDTYEEHHAEFTSVMQSVALLS
jgi:hypothetical protein